MAVEKLEIIARRLADMPKLRDACFRGKYHVSILEVGGEPLIAINLEIPQQLDYHRNMYEAQQRALEYNNIILKDTKYKR